VPVGFLAVGCGGNVDLDSPKAVAGAAANQGGAGTTPGGSSASGGSERGGSGSSASGGVGAGASGGSSSTQAGTSTGAGGAGGAAVVGEAAIAWLAYDAQPDDEQRGIYLTSAARGGGCFVRVTPSDVTAKQPSFSDDGKLIAYAAEDEPGRYQIHVVELATGATRQVTQLPQGASYPAFSPSGGGIAFVTGDPEALRDGLVDEAPGAGDLMQVDLKTLETTVIRPMQGDDVFPYFSPAFSGNRIFFSNSYKMLGAFFMPSGTTIKEIAPSLGTLAQDPAPSPDGRSLAYVDSCSDWLNLYIVDLALGSLRSCVAPSREIKRDQGYISPDWGQFGFIAVELNVPQHGLYLLNETDGTPGGGGLATQKHARNPDWAPESFTRVCE
jgi:dipeptidyl aminopeptidase/acylaminoacyl peptidase